MIRKGMKAMVAALGVTAIVAGASVAQAAITFDPDGVGGTGAIGNVGAFDWSPGNVLSVGGQTAVNNLLAGGPTAVVPQGGNNNMYIYNNTDTSNEDYQFISYYQAKLANLSITSGSDIAPSGWEITVVAKVRESLSNVIVNEQNGTAAASFSVVTDNPAENYIEIYAHRVGDAGTSTADDLAGTGFNDGHLILSGTIVGGDSNFTRDTNAPLVNLDAFGNDDYSDIDTIVSAAGSSITMQPYDIDVNFIDTSYFLTGLDSFTLDFLATSQLAFNSADPSARFLIDSTTTAAGFDPTLAGAGAHTDLTLGIGTINGVNGPSFQFLADGNSAVNGTSVVPEPATAAMGLIGLAGLAIASRRRRA